MYMTTNDFNVNMDKALRPALNIEIEYGQIDPDARDTATVSEKTTELVFGNATQILNVQRLKENTKVGTLEKREMLLDGNFPFPPTEQITDNIIGFRPDIVSDANGVYATCPYIKITANQNINAAGIVITWSPVLNQYAVDFDVYVGTTVHHITGNTSIKWESDFTITGSDYIKIVIKKWCKGYTRPKLTHIDFGFYIYFTEENLTDLSITDKYNPISTQFSDGTISLSFLDLNHQYNVFELDAKQNFVTERQPITTKVGYEDKLQIGYHELSGKPVIDNSKVKLTGYTLSHKLDVDIPATLYTTKTLYYIVADIFAKCGISKCSIDESLKSITYPVIIISGKAKDIISNACIASTKQMWQNGDTMYIGSKSTVDSGYDITANNEQNPTISIDNVVKKLQCNYTTFTQLTTAEQLTTYTPTESGNCIIGIDYATSVTVTGGTLISSAINYVTVTGTAGTEITVSGKKIISTELKATKTNAVTDGITLEIQDNPFIITATQANNVLTWINNYYSNTKSITSKWRQNPALQCGDTIGVATDFGIKNIIIEENTLDFKNGGLQGTTKGRCV